VNINKLIAVVFTLAFAGVTFWAVTFFVQMQREITVLRAQEAYNRERLAETEAKLVEQQKYLEKLRTDPVLVEKLIREKLRYSRSDEFVFRFEDEKK
jgi:cell division protein FtsB